MGKYTNYKKIVRELQDILEDFSGDVEDIPSIVAFLLDDNCRLTDCVDRIHAIAAEEA